MQRYWPLLWDTRCKSSMGEHNQIHFLLFSIPILFSQMIQFLIAVLFHNANCLAQSILVHVAGQVLYSLLLTCQCICWGKWEQKWKWGWIIYGVEVAGTGPRLCDFLAKKIQEIHVISIGPRLCDFLAKIYKEYINWASSLRLLRQQYEKYINWESSLQLSPQKIERKRRIENVTGSRNPDHADAKSRYFKLSWLTDTQLLWIFWRQQKLHTSPSHTLISFFNVQARWLNSPTLSDIP